MWLIIIFFCRHHIIRASGTHAVVEAFTVAWLHALQPDTTNMLAGLDARTRCTVLAMVLCSCVLSSKLMADYRLLRRQHGRGC